jgi:hypothetical protein
MQPRNVNNEDTSSIGGDKEILVAKVDLNKINMGRRGSSIRSLPVPV